VQSARFIMRANPVVDFVEPGMNEMIYLAPARAFVRFLIYVLYLYHPYLGIANIDIIIRLKNRKPLLVIQRTLE